ncbi:MAG TPA: lysophospholipid acyltransferase family protein [Bellilinea sp.]|nr:lysophospholipid acyltransferase family protein [Bellilinea sp.]
MSETDPTITYPRRKAIRAVLRTLIRGAFAVLADFNVIGTENLPKEGPLLVIGNHFSFLDPVALIGMLPFPLEFIGGSQMPNAPGAVSWLARVYGVLPVRRGSISRDSLRASRKVLNDKGVLGIFPEGGSWATVLRPARPGSAYLATCTHANILPVGLDGLIDLFPSIRAGRRPKITFNIGKPFGPFFVSDRGVADRQRLDDLGHEFMRRIAELIPAERRGHYSGSAAIREAAVAASVYPWENTQEQ